MRPVTTLSSLYDSAAVATAAGSKSFYFATRFFPPDLARAAHAVYWFCRYTDDLVDEAPSVEQGRAALNEWETDVRAALHENRAEHEVLQVFLDAVNRYEIPAEYPLELIAGMRMDLDGIRYGDFTELRVFCYRVASVVGLMMCHVIGFRGAAQPYAIDLGIAMQLTNILRDIGEDLGRGRVYLPADEMAIHGYSEEELRAGVCNEAFRQLVRFQIQRARQFYLDAEPGIQMLDRRGRFAVKVASDVYRAILYRIEAADYDVFTRRAVVPAAQKYWLTARNMAGPMMRHYLRLGCRP